MISQSGWKFGPKCGAARQTLGLDWTKKFPCGGTGRDHLSPSLDLLTSLHHRFSADGAGSPLPIQSSSAQAPSDPEERVTPGCAKERR